MVATKAFNHFYPDGHRHGDLSRQHILDACDAILQRLALDHIDLYQCHGFDPLTHPEEVAHAITLEPAATHARSAHVTVEAMI